MTAATLPSDVPPHLPLRFTIPTGSEADGPPEARGLPRDGVRLLARRPNLLLLPLAALRHEYLLHEHTGCQIEVV